MYVVLAEFVVAPEGRATFVERVVENARASVRDEPGCHQFDVSAAPEEPGRILLYELYDDAEAFGAHRRSAHFLKFDAAVKPWVLQRNVRTFERIEPSGVGPKPVRPGGSRA